MRSATIAKRIRGGHTTRGPDTEWVVYLYNNDNLIEERHLGIHNKHYAEDVAENWINGIINPSTN